jgi:ribonuclease HI
MEVSNICIVCGLEREDTYHTFCRCPLAKNLWEAMQEVWPLIPLGSIRNTGPEWLLEALSQLQEQGRLLLLMTLWRIWHVRNEVVHLKPAPPVEASRRFLCSYVDSLLMIKLNPRADPVKGKAVVGLYSTRSSGERKKIPAERTAPKRWSKPPPGWTKLNVDGAWEEKEMRGGTGMILRDEEGNTIVTACKHLKSCASPLEAEALAVVEGLKIAVTRTDRPIMLESDCLELISMMKEVGVNRSSLATTINEAKRLWSEAIGCNISHISREVNEVSHTLARLGCKSLCTNIWDRSGLDIISSACNQDKLPLI